MLHVVARSAAAVTEWTRRHPTASASARFHIDRPSYFDVLNEIIRDTTADYALVVHDDVFLSERILEDVAELISELDSDWPAWGVCGNAGVLSFGLGCKNTKILRYLRDPHGGPNYQGIVVPAQSIDGNVMLLNTRALRDRGIGLPAFEGFQFYDLVLCIEALYHDLAVLIAPRLTSVHLSGGSQEQFDKAAQSFRLHRYLLQRLANAELATLNGLVKLSAELPTSDQEFQHWDTIDIELHALQVAARKRQKRQVAIVIRTQFRDQALLRRALETAQAFAVAAGDVTEFKPFVVTDRPADCPDFVHRHASVIAVDTEPGIDSRFKLIQCASGIDADFLWFVDDDDWLFPNEAERLGFVVNIVPPNALLFIDTQWFHERIGSGGPMITGNYSIIPGRYFFARDWAMSLSGDNYIPFCGMIVPTQLVRTLDPRLFERVVYYEDFTIQLSGLISPGTVQIVVEKLFSGISVRETGNSITVQDRMRWDKSYVEMIACLCSDPRNPNLFSLWPLPAINPVSPAAQPAAWRPSMEAVSRPERSLLLAYRLTLGLIIIAGNPRRWIGRAKRGLLIARNDGMLSVLKWITIFWRGK
jgi:hypothetical protein